MNKLSTEVREDAHEEDAYGVRWGKKVHETERFKYYESFFLDGTKYSVKDTVYLNAPEGPPYIAMIGKLYENVSSKNKIMFVRWFYRPCELPKGLSTVDYSPTSKIIFMAAGSEYSKAFVTPACTIAKCRVLCTSKQSWNTMPSAEDVKAADYSFNQAFDPVELKLEWLDPKKETCGFLLGVGENLKGKPRAQKNLGRNPRNERQSSQSGGERAPKVKQYACQPVANTSRVKAAETGSGKGEVIDKTAQGKVAENVSLKEEVIGKTARVKAAENVSGKGEVNGSTFRVKAAENASVKGEAIGKTSRVTAAENVSGKGKANGITSRVKAAEKVSGQGDGDCSTSQVKAAENVGGKGDGDGSTSGVKAAETVSGKSSLSLNTNVERVKGETTRVKADKTTGTGDVRKSEVDFSESGGKVETLTATTNRKENIRRSEVSDSMHRGNADSIMNDGRRSEDAVFSVSFAGISKDIPSPTVVQKGSQQPAPGPSTSKVAQSTSVGALNQEDVRQVVQSRTSEVTRRKSLEDNYEVNRPREKPVFRFPWDEKGVDEAVTKRRALLLQNIEPTLNSSELEVILEEVLDTSCNVRILPPRDLDCYTTAEAVVIFRDSCLAEEILHRLTENFLVISADDRPVLASMLTTRSPVGSSFNGFFNLEKFGLKKESIGHRTAVATSHCAQPNTVEYELGLMWRLLQERHSMAAKMVQDEHEREILPSKRKFICLSGMSKVHNRATTSPAFD